MPTKNSPPAVKINQSEIEWISKLAQRLADTQNVVEWEDLRQVGLEAFLKIAPKHDPAKGASLKTFCTERVRGAMLNEITKNSPGARQRGEFQIVNVDTFDDAEIVDSETPELISEVQSDNELRRRILNTLPTLLDNREAQILQMFLNGYSSNDVASQFKITSRRAAQILAGVQSKVADFVKSYVHFQST